MTRRHANWMIVRAAAVGGGPEFFAVWLKTAQSQVPQQHNHASTSYAPPEPDRWTSYKPKFFSAEEFQILEAFTEILIPTDETPGAREAHVAPFIDFVVNAAAEYAPEMQLRWRRAMDWLRGQGFGNLPPERKIALVQQMSEPERNRSKTHDGFGTYKLIKDMTVHAFYTSRLGIVDELQYKGNAYLTEFPGCGHPEHHRV